MREQDVARAIVRAQARAARTSSAHRRVKIVNGSEGRYVVSYRGQEVTLPSGWDGNHAEGSWFNAAYVDGQLQLIQPAAYGGKLG